MDSLYMPKYICVLFFKKINVKSWLKIMFLFQAHPVGMYIYLVKIKKLQISVGELPIGAKREA